ncbi:TPA: DUF2238 domain-containing protein [Candidatus Pacearchaeota archaeon]|nr:DUF2238 domain-containing protein [Candidatus Pacearchaeota archaeon]
MRKELKFPVYFVYLFLISLLIYIIPKGNYEFIGYAVVIGFLFYFLTITDKLYKYSIFGIWLFAIWVVLHLFGGILYFGGTRLYDIVLINLLGPPYDILKYDQFVHTYCYFAIAILLYYPLKKYMKVSSKIPLIVFAILSAIGIGLLNEVIEFGMVIFADAADAVGGYYNTALDLVFNLIGAIIGAVFVSRVLDEKNI